MYVKSGMQKHPSFGWKYGNACQVCMVKFVAQLHFPGMPEVLLFLVSKLGFRENISQLAIACTQNGHSQQLLLLHS